MCMREHQRSALEAFQGALTDHFAQWSGPVDVLEVGGGSKTKIQLPHTRFVSLDIDADSLARGGYARMRIVGDAQSYDFKDRSFDIAVFWNVLEHVANPQVALRNIARTVRPAGTIVVAGPMLRSLKGIVTRRTPHWVHVQWLRIVGRSKTAGTDGDGPFPVEHHRGSDIDALVGSLASLDFDVRFRREYQGVQLADLSEFSRLLYALYAIGSTLLRWLTFGRMGGIASDFILVAHRRARA